MRASIKNVIGRIVAISFFVTMINITLSAQSEVYVNPVVDSLFVIASSGEVMHQEAREPAMDSIATYGTKVVPFMVEKLNAISRQEKWTAVWILERIAGPAVPFLVDKLSSSDGRHVQRVCWALSRMGDSTAVDGLIRVVSHSRWQVREEALGALGKINDSQANEAVLAALVDSIGQVRKGAAVAAGKLLPPEGIEPMIKMLADDFYGARMSAFEALGNYDSKVVLRFAMHALPEMKGREANLFFQLIGRTKSALARETLYELSNSDDSKLRSYAALALIQSDPQDSLGYHQQLLDQETDRLNRLKIESAFKTIADEVNVSKEVKE